MAATPYPMHLSVRELDMLSVLWGDYFDGRDYDQQDPKHQIIALIKGFFQTPGGADMIAPETEPSGVYTPTVVVVLDYPTFCERFMVPDFRKVLYERPQETIACVGLAASLARVDREAAGGLAVSSPAAAHAIVRVTARFVNVEPMMPLAALKSSIVGRFICIRATVVRCSAIRPLVLDAQFECPKCGMLVLQKFPDGVFEYPQQCPSGRCKNRVFELRRETARAVDFQKIKVQEITDDDAEPGRVPRTVEIELREDLVDSCIPGDVVTVAGVVKSMNADAASNKRAARDGRHQSLYLLYVQANSVLNRRHVERKAEYDGEEDLSKVDASGSFSVKHLSAIRMIASEPLCFDLLVASLCPSIFGHELVKAGLLLTLLGGTKRHDPTSIRTRVRVRSDPHILLVGDPGLGKSQMLRAAASAAPRSVYVCGNVVTSTGLTVTLVADGRGDVGLEAGALVLADQGVCCVDELDKLSCSQHALLEAMEQQQISIAKSGVVASLSARCSIIAAANPVGGHYHRGKTVSENLKMSGALFSRFDLVFIMLDRPDEQHDERLSRHITSMHRRGPLPPSYSQGYPDDLPEGPLDRDERNLSQRLRLGVARFATDPVPMELLRKYIAYARKYVHPRLSQPAALVLQECYLKMRSEARQGRSMPITTRQLESLIRLAQARAKAELRDVVTKDDALDVVEMMQESLLDAYTDECGQVDFSHHSGSLSLAKQVKAFVAALTKEADRRSNIVFPRSDLQELAERMGLKIADFDRFLDVLNAECYILKAGPKLFKVMTSSTVSASQR